MIELYDLSTGKIPEMEGLDDRQKDILEPLACINLVIDELANDENRTTFNTLIELSKDMGKKRVSHEKLDGSITTMIEIIEKELGDKDEWFIPVSRLLERANMTDGLSFRNKQGSPSANSFGRSMSKLDIFSDQKWINGENIKRVFYHKGMG